MVFYRKYRPQTIGDLDSTKVRETLLSVLSIEPPHAFLFTGPKGLGKTSTARIIAKVVNCTERDKQQVTSSKKEKKEKPVTGHVSPVTFVEPCNNCDQCRSITNGTNLDVIEIDAASNRGIDEMRDLKDKIRLAPLSARKKVYIIDEVHMLTTEAFNALLKTLEEPPEHAMFLLCTTEPQKVPPTILSRCFHIAFAPATDEELVRSFRRIAEGEKLEVDDETLREIAHLAEGGFRDGAKIMEELAAFAPAKHITKELVEQRFQIAASQERISSLVTSLAERDTILALQLVQQLVDQQSDIKYFLAQCLERLHQLLLEQVGMAKDAPKSTLSLEEIKILLELFSEAYSQLRTTVLPQLPLELAIITWSEMGGQVEESSAQEDSSVPTAPKTLKKEVSVASLKKQLGTMAKARALSGETEKDKKVASTLKTTDVKLLQWRADGEITPEWLEAFWKCLIGEMKTYNHTVAGVLRGCMLKSFDRKNLVIETAYSFHKERLDEGKTREVLEEVCKTLTGQPVAISVVLTEK